MVGVILGWACDPCGERHLGVCQGCDWCAANHDDLGALVRIAIEHVDSTGHVVRLLSEYHSEIRRCVDVREINERSDG